MFQPLEACTAMLMAKEYFTFYSKILREIMKTAKRTYYNNLIVNSENKTKTIWNIVKKRLVNIIIIMTLHY
jgi:DNA-binding LacI/PurR family transcriptional regulator